MNPTQILESLRRARKNEAAVGGGVNPPSAETNYMSQWLMQAYKQMYGAQKTLMDLMDQLGDPAAKENLRKLASELKKFRLNFTHTAYDQFNVDLESYARAESFDRKNEEIELELELPGDADGDTTPDAEGEGDEESSCCDSCGCDPEKIEAAITKLEGCCSDESDDCDMTTGLCQEVINDLRDALGSCEDEDGEESEESEEGDSEETEETVPEF